MLIFLLVCVVFGGLIGFGAAMLEDAAEAEEEVIVETVPEEEEDPVAFGHAIICPDCGGYRNEDAETCPICARNENIKGWLESERNDENISIPIDN